MKKSLTKDEKSLLLYFEARAVDHSGTVDSTKMNDDDFKIARRWNENGFVEFGRIYSGDLKAFRASHWCHLSPDAWKKAAKLRKEKAARTFERRYWRKTSEAC